jgi:glutaconate CoA-transferase subunit B
MTEAADLVTTLLARDIVESVRSRGLRVFAMTSPVSVVAGLLAQRIGAPGLALAGGFGRLDVAPRPAVTSGEFALGMDASPHSMSAETFMALARGRVGVVVSPAQIDARAALNLSGVGGVHARPAVALPGSRGLPDNNHSRSMVWYFVPEITTRRLVAEVDFISGAPPAPGIRRRLFAPTATLEFDAANGWRIVGLTEGTSVEDVRAATSFELAADSPATSIGPSVRELAALVEVDPNGLRRLDFGAMPGDELGEVIAEEARELADLVPGGE